MMMRPFRGEFDAVLDQVPKDLLQSSRIAFDVLRFRASRNSIRRSCSQNFLATNFISALQDLVHAHGLQAELQLAFGDPGDVEKIVDQARFEFDVAPNYFQARRGFRANPGRSLPIRPPWR